MNKFELYCMIFYFLDAEYDENKSKALGDFLSGANPFLFTDIGSADPAVYVDFSNKIPEKITLENSLSIASEYIDSLNNDVVSLAFDDVNQDEWFKCVKEYLLSEHKGSHV